MSYKYMAHRRARASRGRRADARGSASAQPADVATRAFSLGGFSHIFAFKGAFQAEVRDGNNISRVFERARATDAARARATRGDGTPRDPRLTTRATRAFRAGDCG